MTGVAPATGSRTLGARMGSVPHAVRIAVLMAVGALCAFAFIGKQTLSFDEGVSRAYARLSPGALWFGVHHHDPPQALYYAVLHVWSVFGHSPAALRSLSAVAFILAIPFAYGIARELFGDEIAMITGILLATSSFAADYADDMRPYGLVLCFSTISTYAFIRAVAAPRRRILIVYALSAAASIYFHLFAAFLIAGHALSLPAIAERPAASVRRLLPAYAAVAILCIPLAVLLHTTGTGQVEWIPRPRPSALWDLLTTFAGARFLAILFGCAVAAAIAAGLARMTHQRIWAVCVWTAVPIVLSYGISLIVQPIFFPRYLMVVFVPFLVLVALGVEAVRKPALVALATCVLVALSLHSLWFARHSPGEGGDFLSAAQYLQTYSRSDDAIVAYAPPEVFAYRAAVDKLPLPPRARMIFPSPAWKFAPGTAADKAFPTSVELRGYDRVWFVVMNRTRINPRHKSKRARLEAAFMGVFRSFRQTSVVDFSAPYSQVSVLGFQRLRPVPGSDGTRAHRTPWPGGIQRVSGRSPART